MNNSTNFYTNFNNQQQFRLNKINEIMDYFIAEIRERDILYISKYIDSSDCFDKSLIVWSGKNASISISIASFATAIVAPVCIANTSFSFAFSITTWLAKIY